MWVARWTPRIWIATPQHTAAPARVQDHNVALGFIDDADIATPSKPGKVAAHPFHRELQSFEWGHRVPRCISRAPKGLVGSHDRVANCRLTDALGQRFTLDVVDPRAGFAMTAWQATVLRDGVPDLRYRTKLTARFLGDDWRHVQLRDEANWQRGEEWDVGYDVAQLDSVAADLRARLGKRATP